MVNNLVCSLFIVIVFFLIHQQTIKTFPVAVGWFSLIAFLNCIISFRISYSGYFRTQRNVKTRTERALFFIQNTVDARNSGRQNAQ